MEFTADIFEIIKKYIGVNEPQVTSRTRSYLYASKNNEMLVSGSICKAKSDCKLVMKTENGGFCTFAGVFDAKSGPLSQSRTSVFSESHPTTLVVSSEYILVSV